MEAVEPPATGAGSPAQAEDAGADEVSGQRGLQSGERDHVPRHGGVNLAGVHQLDDHIAAAQLRPDALSEGSHEVFGGRVLSQVRHHVETGG